MVAQFISHNIDRLPPTNVEAEEAILGGILLDPDAMSRVSDLLIPEAFSITHFQKIFQACKKLYEQNKPTDLMTVTSWLSDRNLLDAVGGVNQLILLVERTVSAANIDQYAALVAEKYCRREMMKVTSKAYDLSCQTSLNIGSIAEQLLTKVQELPFLPREKDLDTHKYHKCISEIRAIELNVTDPGLKAWRLKKLASKYDCSPRQLEEIYYRSLLAEDDEPMMTWEQSIEKHGSSVREWRMHGWLPKGKLIIEHGDGGSGKTRLSYNFLYHIATGQDWDGFPVKQGRSIVVQTDEAPSDMLQVLEDRGLANNPNIRYKTRWNIDFLQGLIKEIEEFNPAFILIDSLTSINKRTIFSENDVEYARPLLLLKDIAQKYGITIIVIHHSSREGNARGTTAIRNSASEVWQLKVDNSRSVDGSHRVLKIEKSRSRQLASYLLRYNDEDGSWTCLGKTDAGDNNEGGVGGLTKEKIVRFLRRTPGVFYHSEEIQNEIGGGADHIRRSCSELSNEGIISRKGRRPSLYGINFGAGGEPDAPPTEPSGLSISSLPDTTDQSVDVINSRSVERSVLESSTCKVSSEFRSTDHQNSVFFMPTEIEKKPRSVDRLIGRNNSNHQESLEPLNNGSESVVYYRNSIGDDTTDHSVQKEDRSDQNGSNVTQLNNSLNESVTELHSPRLTDKDIQDFAGLIRQAIADPECTEDVQKTLSTCFANDPKNKNRIWKALTKNERESFKALTAKPTDWMQRQLKVGDRVVDFARDSRISKIGEITALQPEYKIGPKKDMFVHWVATVQWDDETYRTPAEFLQLKQEELITEPTEETELKEDGGANLEDAVDIKAITLHQPWASLVGRYKHYETRSWKTNYRGKIAIHAAKLIPSYSTELLELVGKIEDLPLGAVIAIADLTECIEITPEFILQQTETELKCGDWQPGRFAYKLDNVQFLETPIPTKGQQGLWDWKKIGSMSIKDFTEISQIDIQLKTNETSNS